MRRSSFYLFVAGKLLRLPPVPGFLRPPAEGIGALRSPRSFYLVVLGGGVLGDMAEALLDNVVSVCGGGGQVVEAGVNIRGQVRTIRETGKAPWDRGWKGTASVSTSWRS